MATRALEVLSEYESVKSILMNFNKEVNLKLIVEFSAKDSNGNKKRSFEEFRYRSDKYRNYDHLVSATMKFNSYLSIDYPNQRDEQIKTSSIFIRAYALDGLYRKMCEFDDKLFEAFAENKKGELVLKQSNIVTIQSYPTANSTIEFSQDLFEDADGNKDVGVRLGFNEEFYFTIRAATTWKSFMYYISKCDLFGWGSNIAAGYMSNLNGNAVSELGSGKYYSASRYSPYGEDPDEIINQEGSVRINRSKPVTKYERQKSFFDD